VPRPGTDPRWPAVLLAAAWGCLLLLALWSDPVTSRGLYREEETSWLAASSLIHDGDRRLEAADLKRYRAVWQRPVEEVEVARNRGGAPILAVPPLYALVLAPAVGLVSARGAFLLQTLLFGAALWFSARILRRNLGRYALLWLLLAAFASVAFASVFRLTPALLGLCLAVLAVGLTERHPASSEDAQAMPEVYGEAPSAAHRGGVGRWLVIGLVVGGAASLHPLLLLLVVAVAPRAAGIGRWRRWGALAVGMGLVLGLIAGLQRGAGLESSPWPAVTEHFTLQTGYPLDGTRWPEAAQQQRVIRRMSWRDRLDPHLIGWNLLYLVAGRHIGLLPYFLPLGVGLALWAPGTRRWPLALSAGLALFAAMMLDPFRLGGAAASVGNGNWLPFYGALWFLPTRSPARLPVLATAILGGLLLWPLWLTPAGYPVDDAGRSRQVSPLGQRSLPYETSQQSLPGGDYVAFAGVHVRAATGTIWEDPAHHSFRILGRRGGEIVIAYAHPIQSVDLSFDRDAPTDLSVTGGKLESTVFRPSGGISFRIALSPAAHRHPMWWARGPQYLYPLELRFPKAKQEPLRFSLAIERGTSK